MKDKWIKVEDLAMEVAAYARYIKLYGEDETTKNELFDHFETLEELITEL